MSGEKEVDRIAGIIAELHAWHRKNRTRREIVIMEFALTLAITGYNASMPGGAARVGQEPMRFGRYKGTSIDDVPLPYLDHITSNSDQMMEICGYLCSEAIRNERCDTPVRTPQHKVTLKTDDHGDAAMLQD